MDPIVPSNLYDQINLFFQESSDFVSEQFSLYGSTVHLCYFESLVDIRETRKSLLQLEIHFNEKKDTLEQIVLTTGGTFENSFDNIVQALLSGRLSLFSEDGLTHVMINPTHPRIARNVDVPQSENVIESSFDAFTEDIKTNISMLRTKINSKDLVIGNYMLGAFNPRRISLFHVSSKSQPKVVQRIIFLLEKNKEKEIEGVQDLSSALGLPKFSLVPAFVATEIPSETVRHLMEGRIVIFLDHYPYALAVPGFANDLWSMHGDRNFPFVFMVTIRAIRMLGLFVGLIAPGLYVALVSVNPEVLRIQLALSVALSREGVPYPALVEVLLMLGILEMIIEASLRLPKSIGPTVTMVGGIILGQAVVQAKLVSNLLIIILAATTIANFTLVGYQNAFMIRLFKYIILIISAIYGLLGTLSGVVWVCFYIASVTTFQYPYLNSSMKSGGTND
ncbi:spore germination protein [Bacillus sp. FJAT-26390]|uniref:spore germination protein n=1 Tax=Bacillus sp. FJAT-26390 TaxID=1743142 RepID=UPI000807B3A9|nr:spore germination protein [Bacillus sp. FJAT-26390]OBZ16501.1 hypothetical protein A7975_00815 [Bacillus sp. FJAT-26390]